MKKILLISFFLTFALYAFAQFSYYQTLSTSIVQGSADWFDADGDGDLDLFTTGQNSTIYNNIGTSFTSS